ncbi:MAG: DedA family protein [Calditrichia bacterium]
MEAIINTIQNTDPVWAYLILFVSAFVENIFPPVPGDTVTIFGAYLVGRGSLQFEWVWLSTTLGSIAGFMTLFGLAYWLEWEIMEKKQLKWVSRKQIERVEKWFGKFGYTIILFNRFLSGARSVISLAAGFSRLKPLKVTLLALISCLLWNGLLIYLGSAIGQNWSQIVEYLKVYNRIIVTILVALGVIYFVYRIVKRRRAAA